MNPDCETVPRKTSTDNHESRPMLKEAAKKVGDIVSKMIGYAATREWTPSRRAGERIISLKAYTQLNSYSCGVAAGFSVVKTFLPQSKFEEFYNLVDPDKELGTPTRVLRRALRQSGISVRSRRLNYQALLAHIREDRPVIVIIRNPGAESRHWVVAYGFGRDKILLASNGIPWIHKRWYRREEFTSMWEPRGNGLVCWAEKRQPRIRRTRGGRK